MKISSKWVIPLAVVVLTFSIAGAAFAASGSSSDTQQGGLFGGKHHDGDGDGYGAPNNTEGTSRSTSSI